MTSQSRRKHPITARISLRETTKPGLSRSKAWFRASILAAIPFGLGLVLTSQSYGQQPPAWSPQPYSKPQANNADVPANSLRSNNSPANDISNSSNTAVARWRKIDRAADSKNTSYSQTLAPAAPSAAPAQNGSATPARTASEQNDAPVVRKQAVTPANRIVDSAIQPASFAQPVASRSEVVEHESNWEARDTNSRTRTNSKATSDSTSSRRSQGVKLANYQGESIEPPSLALPPSTPSPNRAAPSNRSLLPQTNDEPETLPRSRDRSLMPQSPSDRNGLQFEDSDDRNYQNGPSTIQRTPRRSVADCDNLRQVLEESDITKIRVDSSPAFVEGYKNVGANNSKENFVQQSGRRAWYSLAGEEIANGRLVDLAYGSVVIEQRDGNRVTYLLNRLSDADQVYVSESWGIPVTCSLNDGAFDARNFIATTMTWKASGACHKPLYFEDVQLERYGHEWGPVVQPAISNLNFVKNVVFLPYKMGIHPMNECQYSLGYYRPGSCAPWTVGPIPISLRGAAAQAAVVGGAAWALP